MSSPPPGSSSSELVDKKQLPSLFYHYVLVFTERSYYPPLRLFSQYMTLTHRNGWFPLMERFLECHRNELLISKNAIRQLAQQWAMEHNVVSAINDMHVAEQVAVL